MAVVQNLRALHKNESMCDVTSCSEETPSKPPEYICVNRILIWNDLERPECRCGNILEYLIIGR